MPSSKNFPPSAPKERARRTRAPASTREKLVTAAFTEIHRHGFQGASLDTILASAGVTKGALYHHFDDKAALGHAVIDEVIGTLTLERWTGPLTQSAGDPISALQAILATVATEFGEQRFIGMVELGCPLNNIAQEMSPLNESFRERVVAIFDRWIDAFAKALERGRKDGSVRREVSARKVAAFIVASVEGSFGLAKGAKSAALLRENLTVLSEYLETLRAKPTTAPRRRAAIKRRA